MESIEIKTALSTATDGRTRDLRYRQRQFISLHHWITSHLVDIETGVCKDEHMSELEARFMVSLTLRELERSYNELDLRKTLDEEYRVKNGRNNATGTSPESLIYIVPERFTLFYSVICALSSCIAAGVCSIIELPVDLTNSASVTRQCLMQSLDRSAFLVTSARPPNDTLTMCLIVDQTGTVPPSIGKRIIWSQPHSLAVAIVDRTANIKLAAKELLCSKTFFAGKSPYAPNIILINEFIEQDFLQLLHEQLPVGEVRQGYQKATGIKTIKQPSLEELSLHREGVTCFVGNGFKILKIKERDDLLLRNSKQADTVLLFSTSSHEDAIDSLSNRIQNSLLALYVFAAPQEAKYLTQFIRSDASFVNHIPANLLVGPAAPIGYAVSPVARYRREMLEIPSPKYVTKVCGELDLQELLQEGSKLAGTVYDKSLQPLKPTGQPKEGDKNFFAQGMQVGLIFLALPLLLVTLVGISFTIFKLCRYWY